MIVVTGPTGCGKSTSLAAIRNYLNDKEKRKVVTIEDPIEFVHQDKNCIFSQRELSTDTRSFANALKHALLVLYRNGVISREEALARSVNAEELKGMLDASHYNHE